jgi:predicted secreted protein
MFAYIVTYTCIWWVVFYITLPFGYKESIKKENGHADGAPLKPYLGIKALVSSLISLPLTYYLLMSIENKSLIKFLDQFLQY